MIHHHDETVYLPGVSQLPFGIKVGHTWHEIGAICGVILACEIKTFVEIGVHVGGLASLISLFSLYHEGFSYLGVEINPGPIDERFRDMVDRGNGSAQLLFADAIKASKDVQRWVETHAGPAMIYCDGGDKKAELRRYAPNTRPHDVIAVHDFYAGQDVVDLPEFGRGATFPLPETDEEDERYLRSGGFHFFGEPALKGTRILAAMRL